MSSPESSPLLLASHAKVNLHLRVGPRRADGFHSLVSWFCMVGLADELIFTPQPGKNVILTCDHPGVPCDGRNLIIRAAEALRPYARRSAGLKIELRKRIPMGGGLGGGSSNAACVLEAISRLWDCQLSPDQLHHVAATLGSDVSFFLHGPSAICRGRGELVTLVPPPRPTAALIILPGIEMPTPAVYRKFDEMGLGTDLAAAEADIPDGTLDAEAMLARLVNDLEAPAFAIAPELAQLRGELEDRVARPVRMSGSGSTLFTIYANEEQAASAAELIRSRVNAVACRLG